MKKRFDKPYLRKRLKRQKSHAAWQFQSGWKLYWENLGPITPILKLFLKSTGLLRRGFKNSITYDIVHRDVLIKNLPDSFKGMRILHLSDLHIDGMFDHGKRLIHHVEQLEYDLCVITGDFRFLTYGQTREVLLHTKRLVKAIKCKEIIGILGNHDCISMLPELESMGIQMLVNESTQIKRGTDHINIVGVDDSHFYDAADLKRASRGIEESDVKILLAHSQEVIPEAAEMTFDLYLCGHTHGGQLCLPGGIAVIKNTPKNFHSFIKGAWRYKNMQGYTSRGIGSSCLTVRYHCPPEIIVHRLV